MDANVEKNKFSPKGKGQNICAVYLDVHHTLYHCQGASLLE